jgi:hypothetical protein
MIDEPSSRDALHRVAVHVVARARHQATGRFSLRVAPQGFGTPEFGSDARRVRVAGGLLVVESDAEGEARSFAQSIDGAKLRELAAVAGVDLAAALDVGHDTPELGDVDAPIALDDDAAADIAEWFGLVGAALDRVLGAVPAAAQPSLARVWPEHFDVALDAAASRDVRVNLGGSPGDSFSDEPYLYVGPWTEARPGEASFWNAPFGAARRRSELDPDDAVASAAAFLLDGFRRLTPGA